MYMYVYVYRSWMMHKKDNCLIALCCNQTCLTYFIAFVSTENIFNCCCMLFGNKLTGNAYYFSGLVQQATGPWAPVPKPIARFIRWNSKTNITDSQYNLTYLNEAPEVVKGTRLFTRGNIPPFTNYASPRCLKLQTSLYATRNWNWRSFKTYKERTKSL